MKTAAAFSLAAMQIDVRSNVREVLERMQRRRDDVVRKAIPRALNRTAEMARTACSREIRAEGYAFSAAEIKDAITLRKAGGGRLTVSLLVRRRVKSLIEFGARQTRDGVSVKVHKGRKVIKHAFIGQLRNGRTGVYVEDKAAGKTVLRMQRQYRKGSRGGWHDYPVRKLYGPSVGGVYGTDRILALMNARIRETFPARLEHEIKFLAR